ncbi:MAG: SMC-Scp complex subunit ScpB [Chlorobium sp.]|nr:SMC-Scp complex subunit ScpB [Chlorobium sp.]MCF8271376.1 SMC-Scp complex subunit ScpB [Chlorobium sp.]MCF8287735.1 SMC-Scp complex subunit ScpB [Chlorobium sp.]MCF8291287.1 SMC-Scp complex subunit ScpB [Chlorobium sp.]MCF8385382.1 SMC-Scp complex subunit ScpB [Chlorobium sp.]
MHEPELPLHQQVEAVIFASEDAATISTIRQVTGADLTAGQLESIVTELNTGYAAAGLTFRIHRIAAGYRFLTESRFAGILKRLLTPKIRRKLSQSVLEVLSVIAYRQPVTKGEIQQLRGTSPDYAVDRLLERGFITVSGRADSPGRPLQYGTTKDFLDLFGLHSLRDLPRLREIREILQEKEASEYLAGKGDAGHS